MKLKNLNIREARLSLIIVLFVIASFNAFMFGMDKFVDIPYYLFAILVPIFFGVYIGLEGKKETMFALGSMIIAIFWFIALGFSLPLEEVNFMSMLVYFWKALQGFTMLLVGVYLMPNTR